MTDRRVLGLILLLSVLSFGWAQPGGSDKPVDGSAWFGVGVGYPASLHLGGDDIIADGVAGRIDASFYLLPLGALFDFYLELSPKALFKSPDGFYGGGGPLLKAGATSYAFVAGGGGTYLGLAGVIGYETGESAVRFFMEGGGSIAFRISDDQGPPLLLRPSLTLGLNLRL